MADTVPAPRILTVTVGRGSKQSVGGERRALNLAGLWARLSRHEVCTKEQAEWIIPGFVAECPTPCRQTGRAHSVDCGGGQIHRLAANVRTVEALFLDFDNWDEAALTQALLRVHATGYRYICYSSSSYAPPAKCKVRIVFPLAEPYAVTDVRHWRDAVWPALVSVVGLPDADRACSDVSRLYYLPSKPSEHAETFVQEGGSALLPIPVLTAVRPLAPVSRPNADLLAQLRAENDYPPDVELIERVADGAPLATEQGGRHPAILRVTWLLARLTPRPTAESVEALLSASCAALGDERDFLSEAVRAFETAEPEVDTPEAEDFRARIAEQAGTDEAFAQRLAREHADTARVLPGVGWCVFGGPRFAPWADRPVDLVAALSPGYVDDLTALRGRVQELDDQLKGAAHAERVSP